MNADLINGIFESVGAILCLFNVKQIYKDKKVAGVMIGPTLFFASWGIWNLFFYPAVNCWFSFVGGVFLCIFNWWWVVLAFYYTWKNETNVETDDYPNSSCDME